MWPLTPCPQDHRQGRTRARGGEFSRREVGATDCYGQHGRVRRSSNDSTSHQLLHQLRGDTRREVADVVVGVVFNQVSPDDASGKRWMSDTTSRVDKPRLGVDTPGAKAGSIPSRSIETYTGVWIVSTRLRTTGSCHRSLRRISPPAGADGSMLS